LVSLRIVAQRLHDQSRQLIRPYQDMRVDQ